jgi:hypothetical protein
VFLDQKLVSVLSVVRGRLCRPHQKKNGGAPPKISVAGTRTRVSRVRAEYPNQLDYNGFVN